ncbi:unnamed protein product [Acanthoscelides obtectus]|uniref:Uncharacterized protein n=1 Tax=Acanthoscelides obtectus TaxID=200917 RepID=A0A9P0KCN4_ACAOB|nr:unnamed protein product [Acanthoscelides obtectus]CAK1675262.1 4-aminobutyrate aminotransferase [Acanthoscelides obtectus]
MMIAFQRTQRGQTSITEEDLKSAILNQPPGTPELTIMSFKNAEHGTTPGAMSASHSNALSKVDIPAFDWPIADFPKYKYPLDHFESLNKGQDERCLAMVEDLVDHCEKRNMPVAGIAVEPIQSDCTTEASADFFQGLQQITNRRGIYLMFDESRTGCGATGKFWCHENFCLPNRVDAVVFGEKCQLAGFFHSLELSPQERDRIYEPWMGDPVKLYILEAIISLIERFNLMKQVQKTGDYLKNGLMDMEVSYYDLIHSTRGMGTILAFDAQCPALRDNIVCHLRKKGVILGQCGSQGISLRPSLTFTKRHADIFLQKLEEVIKETELKKPKNDKVEDIIAKYGPPPKPFSRPRVHPCEQAASQKEMKIEKKKKLPCEAKNKKSIRPDIKASDKSDFSDPCDAHLEDWQRECKAMSKGVKKFNPDEKPAKKPVAFDGPGVEPKA